MKSVWVLLAMLMASPVWAQSYEQRLKDRALVAQATIAIYSTKRDQLTALREFLIACPRQHLGEIVIRDCMLAEERYRIEFRGKESLDGLMWVLGVSWTGLLMLGKEVDKTKDKEARAPLTKRYIDQLYLTMKVNDELSLSVSERYRALREEEGRQRAP